MVVRGTVKIGVLGGIGPEATGEFYNKLIKRLQERGLIKSNCNFPRIIINSIPAPELVGDEISEKDLLHYIQGLKELELLKPDFIVMVCNTIHLYYEMLQKQIAIPIIDLRKEVKDFSIQNRIKSALILGTKSTIKHGLYHFNGITLFEPTEQEINLIAKEIILFNNGTIKDRQSNILRKICDKYVLKGAQTVILGCTEIAVILDKEKIPKINTMDVLVEAVIKKFIYKSN